MAIITASIPYSRQFLDIPSVRSFSINRFLLLTSAGQKFVEDVKKAGKTISVWTVNQPEGPSGMRSTFGGFLDAVISDKPELFMRLRSEFELPQDHAPLTASDKQIPLGALLKAYLILILSSFVGCLVSLYHRKILARFQSRAQQKQAI